MAASDAGSNSNTLVLLLVGLFGGGGVVGLGTLWQTRGKAKADATATIGGAYSGLLDRYIKELETLSSKVDTLGQRVATLEGKLDRTEHERDWWKLRAEQLVLYLERLKLPVPAPTQHLDIEASGGLG
jgi:hypothetical protein